MAPKGHPVEDVFHVRESIDKIEPAIISATSGAPKYFVSSLGGDTVVLTRRFTPTAAIVIGLLLGPYWPLIFLYKETETLTFRMTPEGSGARLAISGHADDEMQARLRLLTGGGLWLHHQPDEFRMVVGGGTARPQL
jgi:hypothetical protein